MCLYVCRYPVPDYYQLHLQVIKNWTAAARLVRCDTLDTSVSCPATFSDGDRYLQWDINTKCAKYSVRSYDACTCCVFNNCFSFLPEQDVCGLTLGSVVNCCMEDFL